MRLCVRGTLFSTHDLSGRSTISRYIRRTHWFFQLTTSRGGRRLDLKLIYRFYLFNSRPLGEVDTQYHLLPGLMLFFNSRPLGEVDYIALSKNYTAVIFQLTTSRGGRPYQVLFGWISTDFSTHDLSGRSTYNSMYPSQMHSFSTHDLSWRSTAKLHNKSLKFCIFSGHFILEQMSLPFSYKYH